MQEEMRLKTADGPLSVYNGNDDIINSPKRINTLQNSNITNSNYSQTAYRINSNLNSNDVITTSELTELNNINTVDAVQWCTGNRTQDHELANNRLNRHQALFNINSTLAVSLKGQRHGTASSVCSESSPDDSLLDYEEAHQSCSSADTSPQEEDRGFDLSDSESLSEERNLTVNRVCTIQRRGIVNPNYPGFQHLAHTLDYSLKASSDTDFDDDDFDCDVPPTLISKVSVAEANCINNNNNNNEDDDTDYAIDHIESVNQLDTDENVKKVYYDKSFNIPIVEAANRLEEYANFDSGEDFSGNSNPSTSDDDSDVNTLLNPKSHEKFQEKFIPESLSQGDIVGDFAKPFIPESLSQGNIVGDFGKEVEEELDRISFQNSPGATQDNIKEAYLEDVLNEAFEPILERAVELELEEAIERLSVANDLTPSATKYNIEPNVQEPFNKCVATVEKNFEVFEDSTVIKMEVLQPIAANLFASPFCNNIHADNRNSNTNFHEIHKSTDFVNNPLLDGAKAQLNLQESYKRKSSLKMCLESPKYGDLPEDDYKRKMTSLSNAVINSPRHGDVLEEEQFKRKLSDAFLSGVVESASEVSQKYFDTNSNCDPKNMAQIMEVDGADAKVANFEEVRAARRDSNIELEEKCNEIKNNDLHKIESKKSPLRSSGDEPEKFCKEEQTKNEKEKDEDSAVPRKKEKVEASIVKKRHDYNQQIGSLITIPRRDLAGRNRDPYNRRSVPIARDKKRLSPEALGAFDVYNIETAMPKIDLEAIESHLKAAREEERRRRTDREEIRRRLAMGNEDDYYSTCDRPGRKPSLQARLQSGMNLQICFMNETASDTESPSSDSECPMTNPKQSKTSPKLAKTPTDKFSSVLPTRPATLSIGQPLLQPVTQPMTETDFFARQARLQTEARMALAQAKEMARMQMEIERQKQKKSPITEMVRHSLEKVGIPFPEDRRRLSRQILTEMNVAQLQVIVNDLHTQIETLNEKLVKFLMDRDDLHMEQDSMLVDIEDLTRFLGAKEQCLKEQHLAPPNNNVAPPSPAPSSPLAALNSSMKPHLHRIASLVKK